MFTEVYLKTTNPVRSFSQVFYGPIFIGILMSIIFHTIVYSSFVNMFSFVFAGKMLSAAINTRLLCTLSLIMLFGFVARFLHVKEIYKAYNQDLEKTRNHLDKLYISWIFIS